MDLKIDIDQKQKRNELGNQYMHAARSNRGKRHLHSNKQKKYSIDVSTTPKSNLNAFNGGHEEESSSLIGNVEVHGPARHTAAHSPMIQETVSNISNDKFKKQRKQRKNRQSRDKST